MLRTPSSSVIGRNSFTICRHTSRRDNEPERSWNNSIQIWNCFSVLNLFQVSPVRASDHRTETKAEILCRETVYCVQRRRWETLHSVDITHHFTNCGSIDENNKYRFAAFRSSSDHLSSPRISGRFYMRDSGSPWSVPRVGMGSTRPRLSGLHRPHYSPAAGRRGGWLEADAAAAGQRCVLQYHC